MQHFFPCVDCSSVVIKGDVSYHPAQINWMYFMQRYRILALTALGSGLEYYDFVIYALTARYISETFFAPGDPFSNLLKTLLLFAGGYLARPLGGLIFGSLGDKYGRKKTFTQAILLMAIATVAIALLPGYQTLGGISTFLLVLFRLLQGLSQGAELPGALTFIYEHAPQNQRGLMTSLVTMGVGIGSMLGTLVYFLLHQLFNNAQMQQFGWRCAFLLGGVTAFLSYLIRRHTSETPLFTEQKAQVHHQPLNELIRSNWRQVIIGIGITLFSGSYITYYLFLPDYLVHDLHFNEQSVYLAITAGLAWSALLLPIMGSLGDRIGSVNLLKIAVLLLIPGTSLLFLLSHASGAGALWGFVLLYQLCVACLSSCFPVLLAGLFPTLTRYSGVALAYNCALAGAAFFPLLTSYLAKHGHWANAAPWLLSMLAMISLFALINYPAMDNKS